MHRSYKFLQNCGKSSLRAFGLLMPHNPITKSNKSVLHSNYSKMHGTEGKPCFTVCVEGNIGCGKTTLLTFFEQLKDVSVFHEPVNKWTNVKGHNLLDLMYKDPVRWSHLFQTYVQLTMMERHMIPCYEHTKIMERSLFSARYCFVENLFRSGKMSEPEYLVYCEWFKMLSNLIDFKVDLIVYLRTDPAILHERIKVRNRKEESGITLDYLKNLHDLHEEWIFTKASSNSPPILVMDANGSLQQMRELYMKHMKQIVYGQTPPPPKGLSHSPSKSKKKHQDSLSTKSAAAAAIGN